MKAVFTVGNIGKRAVGPNGVGVRRGQGKRKGRAGNQVALQVIAIDELRVALITPIQNGIRREAIIAGAAVQGHALRQTVAQKQLKANGTDSFSVRLAGNQPIARRAGGEKLVNLARAILCVVRQFDLQADFSFVIERDGGRQGVFVAAAISFVSQHKRQRGRDNLNRRAVFAGQLIRREVDFRGGAGRNE